MSFKRSKTNIGSLTVKWSLLDRKHWGITSTIEVEQRGIERHREYSFSFLFYLLLLRHYWRIENINNKHRFIFCQTNPATPSPSPSSFFRVHQLPLLCLSCSRSSSPSPRFTSHSDQCLLRRTWLNSDETVSAPLTNHAWKPWLPLCLHIFLYLCASLWIATESFFFFFSS